MADSSTGSEAELAAVVAWLKQHNGETDSAWIDRLRNVFDTEREGMPPVSQLSEKTIEQIWARHLRSVKPR
ncbi:hypothetical protein [Methylobacterium gnaphalii]|uniref:Uncharacterized protein n=1 Tax=Methylobacterium gnaphalii TaxID=1010610 RepID=A0A512JII6_9HYPH|nr:hypothetical protein [Methylobacterium gnaphalii]GEP09778.1 hypothetical protein MGN01_16230 [Methylobacterium gnaphalii]GJD67306.1 hypothetical protein MMMDOFMJ_0220 [Methylobacterium gnaphalii]GLS49808.1 hypothetical protein GCM10007885_26600 [Methylobacterium gnaphalii]